MFNHDFYQSTNIIDPLPSSWWWGDSKKYKPDLQETDVASSGWQGGKVTETGVHREQSTWYSKSCRISRAADAERGHQAIEF